VAVDSGQVSVPERSGPASLIAQEVVCPAAGQAGAMSLLSGSAVV
jgi:hypothetical protein